MEDFEQMETCKMATDRNSDSSSRRKSISYDGRTTSHLNTHRHIIHNQFLIQMLAWFDVFMLSVVIFWLFLALFSIPYAPLCLLICWAIGCVAYVYEARFR